MSTSSGADLLVGQSGDEMYLLPEAGDLVLGRDTQCDVVLPDPTVSRRHASLHRRNGSVWLEDLGSSGGTWVNDERVERARHLVDGDRIRLAGHVLRYRRPTAPRGATPTVTDRTTGANDVRFSVDRQQAGTINNVGRDQYLAYVQHVQHQRDSFAREIAATRTRATWLIWSGLVVFVLGFGLYAQVILRFMGQVFNAVATNGRPDLSGLTSGPGGAAGIAIGFAAAFIGQLMILVGIVLHIVATARRRRVDRDLPVPTAPWAPQDRSRT